MQRVTACLAAGRSTQRRRRPRQRCLHLNWIPWRRLVRPLVVALMASTFSGVQDDDAMLKSWRHAALGVGYCCCGRFPPICVKLGTGSDSEMWPR